MKYNTLIKTNSWLSVEVILLNLYPDEEKNISGYEDVYNKLLLMSAEDIDMSIVVTNQKDDFDDEKYVDVSGRCNNPKSKEDEFSQVIEFTAWSKWLGMDICEESLRRFSELELIAHCLFEMTFAGFEEDEIQLQMTELEKQIEEYKNMTPEERKTNTSTLEELMKDLDSDKEDEEK